MIKKTYEASSNIQPVRAEVLSTHVTNDLLADDINPDLKSFSSFLPLRTDRYCVLNYGNNDYEILARGKQSKQTPNYQFCIYNKGAEIKEHRQRSYIKRIGARGMDVTIVEEDTCPTQAEFERIHMDL